jgi:hypothetical protein
MLCQYLSRAVWSLSLLPPGDLAPSSCKGTILCFFEHLMAQNDVTQASSHLKSQNPVPLNPNSKVLEEIMQLPTEQSSDLPNLLVLCDLCIILDP